MVVLEGLTSARIFNKSLFKKCFMWQNEKKRFLIHLIYGGKYTLLSVVGYCIRIERYQFQNFELLSVGWKRITNQTGYYTKCNTISKAGVFRRLLY